MSLAILTAVLLGIAVLAAGVGAVGLMLAPDAYQKLHLPALVTVVSAPLIVLAVCINSSTAEERVKGVLIVVTLLVSNALLGHATARAIRIRRRGQWPISPEELADGSIEQRGQP